MFWNSKPTPKRPVAVRRPAPKPQTQPQATKSFGLSIDLESIRPNKVERNADPYNTSGSFDRTKNWERVGKR